MKDGLVDNVENCLVAYVICFIHHVKMMRFGCDVDVDQRMNKVLWLDFG